MSFSKKLYPKSSMRCYKECNVTPLNRETSRTNPLVFGELHPLEKVSISSHSSL